MTRLPKIALAVLAYVALTGAGVYKWVDDKGVTHYADNPTTGHPVTEVPVEPEIPPEETQRAQELARQRLDALDARLERRAATERERREAERLIAEQRRAKREAEERRKAEAQAAAQPPVYPGNYGYGWGGVVHGQQFPPYGPGYNPGFGIRPPVVQPGPCETNGAGLYPPCNPPAPQPQFRVRVRN